MKNKSFGFVVLLSGAFIAAVVLLTFLTRHLTRPVFQGLLFGWALGVMGVWLISALAPRKLGGTKEKVERTMVSLYTYRFVILLAGVLAAVLLPKHLNVVATVVGVALVTPAAVVATFMEK